MLEVPQELHLTEGADRVGEVVKGISDLLDGHLLPGPSVLGGDDDAWREGQGRGRARDGLMEACGEGGTGSCISIASMMQWSVKGIG